MKRLKYGVLVLMTFAFMVFGAQSVMAAETGTTSDGFTWMYEEGTMAVTGYSGDATVITIPATINGKPVTMIHSQSSSESGFSSKLTSVTIPNTVTTIGNSAFDGCSSLTSVTIPNSVTMIGEWAFGYCSSLTGLTIPNSVIEIGDSAFFVCSGLKSATIPHSVIIIGDSAFSGCSSLTSVTIPDSVTKIGSMAFSGCSSLTSVTIPNSVTEIGFYVFYVCRSLTSVTIPNSVTEIGYYSFYGCSSLSNVTIPSTVTTIYEKAFGYYKNALDQEKTVPGFTINGYYGTEADYYASKNGFTFVGTTNDIANAVKITSLDEYTYTYSGNENKPTVTLAKAYDKYSENFEGLKEGTDYSVSYSNNVNAGTATVKVNGINHFSGSISKDFTIEPKYLDVKVKLKKKKYKYTGAQIKPGVTVTQKSPKKTLKKGKDYTVSYSSNIAPGSGCITVTGKNNYIGSEYVYFTILEDKITISSVPRSVKTKVKSTKVMVSWKKYKRNSSVARKDWKKIKNIQVQYSTSKNFDKNVTTKKISRTKTKYTLKLKKKTRYYIRVRYIEKKGASSWSSVKKIKTK